MVLRNLSPKWIRNYCIRAQREKTQLDNFKDMDKCQSATCWVQLCPSLGSYLESFRVYYMPDTVLVNTTNTTLEKRWALSSRRSLSRRKNAYHKISAMGEKDTLQMVQKWREGWELAFERSRATANREVKWSLITHCSESLTCHRSTNRQTWTTECTPDIC